MRRPPVQEWSVLGESQDPTPGDPDAIAVLGMTLRDTADDIWREAGEVQALASVESWKSKAADRFRAAAKDATGELRKAFHRYDVAAGAMGTRVQEGSDADWASALEQAQQMAAKALRDAQAADADHQAATRQINQLPPHIPTNDPSTIGLRKRQSEAASALVKARAEVQAAMDHRAAAAQRARDRIQRAITHDGLHDSTWDKVGHDLGAALSDTGRFLEDMGETALGDLASLGNAMAHDLGAVTEVAGGLGLAALGAGGEILGFGLDLTGIGAALGVPIGVVSAVGIGTGLGLAASGAGQIMRDAAGPDRVTMSSDGGGGGGGGDWSTPAEGDPEPVSEEDQARFTERQSELSQLGRNKQIDEVRKGIEVDGQKYKPEGALLRGAKHGIDWSEGPQRAKVEDKPQGRSAVPPTSSSPRARRRNSARGSRDSSNFPKTTTASSTCRTAPRASRTRSSSRCAPMVPFTHTPS